MQLLPNCTQKHVKSTRKRANNNINKLFILSMSAYLSMVPDEVEMTDRVVQVKEISHPVGPPVTTEIQCVNGAYRGTEKNKLAISSRNYWYCCLWNRTPIT